MFSASTLARSALRRSAFISRPQVLAPPCHQLFFHTCSPLLGGRHTTGVPEKTKHWRANLSKKAKKRIARRKETEERRLKAAAGNDPVMAAAMRGGGAPGREKEPGGWGLVPTAEEDYDGEGGWGSASSSSSSATPAAIAARAAQNRLAIESIMLREAPPERAADLLRRVDARAVLAALRARGARGGGRGEEREWAVAVRALGAQGDLSGALAAVAEMRAAGVPVSLPTYNALLTAAAEARSKEAAVEIFTLLRAQGGVAQANEARSSLSRSRFPSPSPPSLRPDEATYGALLQAHVRAFDLEGAFAVRDAAVKDLDEGRRAAVAAAYAEVARTMGGRIPRAREEEAALKVHQAVAPPSPVLDTHLIVACVHAGKYERALDVFYEMRERGCLPDAVAYTAAVSACAKMDRVEKAFDLLTEMRRHNVAPTHATYNALVHAAGRSMRLYRRAHGVFAEMEVEGLQRDARTYAGVLLACSQEGDVVRAREYMALMARDGVRPDPVVVNTLLTVYARALRDVAGMGRPRPGALAAQGGSLPEAAGSDGGALLALDRDGQLTLSSRPAAHKVLKGSRTNARVVEGPVEEVVEGLLADYFGGGKSGAADALADPEEAAMAAKGMGPDPARHAPALREVSLDVTSPAWTGFREQMVAAGLLDPDLAADIEAEHSRLPALSPREERRRAEAYEARHEDRMRRLAEESLALAAEQEAEAARGGASQPAAAASSSSSSSAVVAVGGTAASSSSSSSSTSGPVPTSATMILEAARKGERLSVREYMAALETEVMTGLFGPAVETVVVPTAAGLEPGAAGAADPAAPRTVQVRRWVSLFDESASIGGTPLRSLLDTSDIRLPAPTKEDVELAGTGARGDGAAELDPARIEAHFRKVVEARVAEALKREAAEEEKTEGGPGAAPSRAALAVREADAYADPYLSDGREEYEDVLRRKQRGGEEGPPPRASPADATTAAAAGSARPSRHTSFTSSADVPPPPSLPPHLASRRSIAARVLGRLLERQSARGAVAGRLESSLVAAAEGVDKARKRKVEGLAPGLLDVIVAVRRLRDRTSAAASSETGVDDGGDKDVVDAPVDPASSPSDGREALRSDPDVAALVEERHLARQSAAAATAAREARTKPGAAALTALAGLSERALAGADWLPGGGGDGPDGYPSDLAAKRAVLLAEARAIFDREFGAPETWSSSSSPSRPAPSLPSLNILLSAYCEAGDLPAAYSFLSTVFPAAGAEPDARTFRPLIRAHVKRGETARAEAALGSMRAMGIAPDAECYGAVVHARARDWRVRDAIETVQELTAAGLRCPEVYASLLRSRCKALGVVHPDVPEHPAGWQFRPENMRRRLDKSADMLKAYRLGGRQMLRGGMR